MRRRHWRVLLLLAMAAGLVVALAACGAQSNIVGTWEQLMLDLPLFYVEFYDDGSCIWYTENEGCTYTVDGDLLTLYLIQTDGSTLEEVHEISFRENNSQLVLTSPYSAGDAVRFAMRFYRPDSE